jgi:hypothetical protein
MNKEVCQETCPQEVTLVHRLRKERKVVRRKRKDQDLQTVLINLKARNHWISEWIANEDMRKAMT